MKTKKEGAGNGPFKKAVWVDLNRRPLESGWSVADRTEL